MTYTHKLLTSKTTLLVFACALLLGFQSSEALATGFDLSKAEDAGNDLITKIRGNLATIVLTIAFIVTGFLAAFNKIPWFWFFAVVLGGFFIFGSTDLANGIKSLFS